MTFDAPHVLKISETKYFNFNPRKSFHDSTLMSATQKKFNFILIEKFCEKQRVFDFKRTKRSEGRTSKANTNEKQNKNKKF